MDALAPMTGARTVGRGVDRRRLVRQVLREVGWAVLAVGVVALLFAAYLIWGTRLAEEASQSALRRGFDAAVIASRSAEWPVGLVTSVPHRSTRRDGLDPLPGGAIDRLQIPAIGLDAYVVNGVSEADLALGPGHYPSTALPGAPGNAAVAGHRTTFGAPFYSLDALRPHQSVVVTDRSGRRFLYRVSRAPFVVPPNDIAVLRPTPGFQLTLTTCTPRYWATSRLVVVARLVDPPRDPARHEALAMNAVPVAQSGTDGSPEQVVLWAAILAVLWLAVRAATRVWRGWPRVAVVAGTLGVAAVILWFTFSAAVVGLLPASS